MHNIIPADSSSTSLGIGLSITFKAGVELLRWLWGAVAQWSEHLQLKQGALGLIPGGYPGFFSLPAGLLMYRNSHYFRSQIFYVRNFRVTIFSSISRVCHIFATYNTIGK